MKNRSQRNVEEIDVLLVQYFIETQSSGMPIQRKYNILSIIEDVNLVTKLKTLYICWNVNKANLRDLIAATGLVILPKLDSNRRFVAV